VLVVLFAAGWSYAIVDAREHGLPAPSVAEVARHPLSPPATPYLLDAAIRKFSDSPGLRGYSGAVRVLVHVPGETTVLADSVAADVEIGYATQEGQSGQAPAVERPTQPGIWQVVLRSGGAAQPVPDLAVLSLVPLSEKRAGKIGTYLIGSWPYETGGQPRSAAYAPPRGLVRVTPENMNTRVSEHFFLRDFLTKGQQNVWPKYVALSPKLLDKMELTIQELEKSGHPVKRVGVISGFRTPQYNAHGGETAGRGQLSRHMYGDAMDWYVDNDGDGGMDDLNGDGRSSIDDARVMAAAADRVEKKYPSLIGGIGTYRPTGAHNGFIHTDTRGSRARW
jgi:uncharacterized protein YcbK (DUF882 family)